MIHIYREIIIRTILHPNPEKVSKSQLYRILSLTLQDERTSLTGISAEDSNEIFNAKLISKYDEV